MSRTESQAAHGRRASTRPAPEHVLRARDVVLALATITGAVTLHAVLLRADMLATLRGARALSPLYASWSPLLTPGALAFAAVAVLVVVFAPTLCAPERTSRARFLFALACAALALPFALYLVRDGASSFGWPFVFYRHEEFLEDAQVATTVMEPGGARGVLVFLRHYVELMPSLSLHGQHFPPGHAVLLAGVSTVTHGSLAAIAACVLALCAGGSVLVFAALREFTGETAARQGALVCATTPALLDFACTSLDAVFFAWAALALVAGLRALRADAEPLAAFFAGLACAAAAFASFSAAPLCLALVLHALLLARGGERPWSFVVRQLGIAWATFVGAFALLWATTGFSIVACFVRARASNTAFMTRNLHAAPSARWLEVSTGNLAAFLTGSGVALVTVLLARGRAGTSPPGARAWTIAALATLAVMTFANLYTLETERIWLFALPWLAALAAARGVWTAASLRVLLGLALVQAFAFEVFLFTLW